jgi:LEA14-like dessication related protein
MSPRSRNWLAAVLPMLACCLLSACASIVPQLQPPVITITSVEFAGGNLQQQLLRLKLHVVNPNARPISVRGIDCTLEAAGQPLASGSTDAAFTLPAAGETDFGFNVTADIGGSLLALSSGLNHNPVDYHLYGKVHLSGGLVHTIPFDQKGRVQF